jgi:ATP-dependent Zn protease
MIRPETVEEIRGALGEVAASRMTYEGEERTTQASADFERLFGGET